MSLLMSQQSIGGVTLTDAEAFIAAAGISDPTQQAAITNLVADLKAASIWTKMDVIYPLVGGSASSHKYNLKNPSDSDGAYRVVYGGTVTHNSNGITGDGSTGYGDTKWNPFTLSRNDNDHLSVYARSVPNGNMAIGSYNGGIRMYGIKPKNSSTNVFMCSYRFDTDGFLNVAHNGETGFWTLTRRASADGEGYKNAVSVGTMGDSTQDVPSETVGLLCRNWGTRDQFADHNLAYVSMGVGLTSAEVLAEYIAVRAYQEALSRALGSAFSDNFDDNSLDTAKWTSANSTDITVSESSSRINMTADSSYSGSFNGASLTTVPHFNFRGRTIDVDINATSALGGSGAFPSGGSQLMVYDVNNSNNRASIILDQDSMTYRRSNNGSNSDTATTNGSTDGKWRIEHVASDNTWKFYTWNGSSWVLRATSAAANWEPTYVKIQLSAYIYGSNQQNVSTQFDNFTTTALAL